MSWKRFGVKYMRLANKDSCKQITMKHFKPFLKKLYLYLGWTCKTSAFHCSENINKCPSGFVVLSPEKAHDQSSSRTSPKEVYS